MNKLFAAQSIRLLVALFAGLFISWLTPVLDLIPSFHRVHRGLGNIKYVVSDPQWPSNTRRVVLSWLKNDKGGKCQTALAQNVQKVEAISLHRSARVSENPPRAYASSTSKDIDRVAASLLTSWNADLAIVGECPIFQAQKWPLVFYPCEKSSSHPRLFGCGTTQRVDLTFGDGAVADLAHWITVSLPDVRRPAQTSTEPRKVTSANADELVSVNFDLRQRNSNPFLPFFEPAGGAPQWEITAGGANSTSSAANVIPKGNPPTRKYITSNPAQLPSVDVSSYSRVRIEFWKTSTSNPRTRNIHNCDSSLNLYYKFDNERWNHRIAFCGNHPKDGVSWTKSNVSIENPKRKKTLSLRFVYGIQNTDQLSERDRKEVEYLIDEVRVLGLPAQSPAGSLTVN